MDFLIKNPTQEKIMDEKAVVSKINEYLFSATQELLSIC